MMEASIGSCCAPYLMGSSKKTAQVKTLPLRRGLQALQLGENFYAMKANPSLILKYGPIQKWMLLIKHS